MKHETNVLVFAARSKRPLYRASCVICGKIGQPQEFLGDAEAIAQRHEEIGGFERAPEQGSGQR